MLYFILLGFYMHNSVKVLFFNSPIYWATPAFNALFQGMCTYEERQKNNLQLTPSDFPDSAQFPIPSENKTSYKEYFLFKCMSNVLISIPIAMISGIFIDIKCFNSIPITKMYYPHRPHIQPFDEITLKNLDSKGVSITVGLLLLLIYVIKNYIFAEKSIARKSFIIIEEFITHIIMLFNISLNIYAIVNTFALYSFPHIALTFNIILFLINISLYIARLYLCSKQLSLNN